MSLEEALERPFDRSCRCGGGMRLAAIIPGLSSDPAHRVFECTECGNLNWESEEEESASLS